MISCGPRVGVSAEADRPWRFWVTGSRFVSDYKRTHALGPISPLTSVQGLERAQHRGMYSAIVGWIGSALRTAG